MTVEAATSNNALLTDLYQLTMLDAYRAIDLNGSLRQAMTAMREAGVGFTPEGASGTR